ncbi:hypothetical protein SAMN02745857_04264 [Andreprevotia lacus DSM 23236]|jgi:hypothetical protein|uniref:Uncharacterized protein n=1 Tax=Andreprevotia lacus DSM 23236 TaxID=1121001 RepID=A0A1W1Y2A6_9NEIS|nr:hypothetical protein [Andreprevotia lacus]SMC29921.1 hypothetical protein SAMN02745857_04264 [Andreprevotia lacus DSM 23236]
MKISHAIILALSCGAGGLLLGGYLGCNYGLDLQQGRLDAFAQSSRQAETSIHLKLLYTLRRQQPEQATHLLETLLEGDETGLRAWQSTDSSPALQKSLAQIANYRASYPRALAPAP